MPVQRPHTASGGNMRRPPRPSRDISQSRGGVMRDASQGRARASQNRSASLQDTHRNGQPPRAPRADGRRHQSAPNDSTPPSHQAPYQVVQADAQQREQQIEQTLSTLSEEDRRVFRLMSGVLERQSVVQAHRLLACLAYQSETRRYLALYGGVSGAARSMHRDSDGDEDDGAHGEAIKSSLLEELEAYHARATAREAAAAQREARQARRVQWVRDNTPNKQQPHATPRTAGIKKDGARAASNGRDKQVRVRPTNTAATAAERPMRAVMPLTNVRSPSAASSVESSPASTSSPSAAAKPSATTFQGPTELAPAARSPLKQTAAHASPETPIRYGEGGLAAPAEAASTPDPRRGADDSTPHHARAYTRHLTEAQELTLHTSLPPPHDATGPSAPEPSCSTRSLDESPTSVPASTGHHVTDAEADAQPGEGDNSDLTHSLFTDQSAPATNAHPTGAVGVNLDDVFGIDATAAPALVRSAAAAVEEEEEEEEDMFVSDAQIAAVSGTPMAVPMAEEPVDAAPNEDGMKLPWDDI